MVVVMMNSYPSILMHGDFLPDLLPMKSFHGDKRARASRKTFFILFCSPRGLSEYKSFLTPSPTSEEDINPEFIRENKTLKSHSRT